MHAYNSTGGHRVQPTLKLGASEITYIAQGFAMGDEEVLACVGAARVEAKALQLLHSFDAGDDLAIWAWSFCRTGNTSQLSYLVDKIFRRGFSGYWDASRMRVFGV